MSEMYRLAVARRGDSREVVIEHDGMLLPAMDALGKDLANLLGKAPEDLQPLLDQWTGCDAMIAEFVRTQADAFKAGQPSSEAQLLVPLATPGKLVCIGSNYHDHIAEMAIPMIPTYPYAFIKPANNTVRGTGEAVAVPRGVKMMDWEAELGVVIGRTCANVPAETALEAVAGYLNFNDLSARDWLANRPGVGVDWVRHKAFDGFAPMGPYLVPSRFVPDPQDLAVRLSINGIMKQDSNTSEMVFGVAAIIEHVSSIMTLYPGDIIATGTPAGTGHGRGEYLKAGDVVHIEIGPLGELVTPIT